jgi:hypothetical protein
MDAHAYLHLVVRYCKARAPYSRDSARRKRDSHSAHVCGGLFRNPLYLVKRQHLIGGRAGAFIHEENARDAPSLVGLSGSGRRRGGDVFACYHSLDAYVFLHSRHLGCHVEIEYIAVIIAVDIENAFS